MQAILSQNEAKFIRQGEKSHSLQKIETNMFEFAFVFLTNQAVFRLK